MTATATFAEKQALRAIDHVGGRKAVRWAKRVQKLASKQGGVTMRENYELLGKRTLKVAVVVAAGVTIGAVAGAVAISRAVATHKAKRDSQAAGVHQDQSEDAEGDSPKDLGTALMAASVPEGFYRRCGKRVCDVVVSVAALPLVGLVIAGCAIAIHREDGGPVFYNAPRVGKDGRDFIMYKLRSMKVDAPDLVMEDGSTYNGADDPRMTRVGAFLRRSSLDEIPQFLNVVKGDMSVVGPRPDLRREVELYRGDEALKLTVRPGVTGYAAVYGRNSLPWHDRLALDVHYVRHLSFPLDAKVFFKTFIAVFRQEGIYVQDAPDAAPQSPKESHESRA